MWYCSIILKSYNKVGVVAKCCAQLLFLSHVWKNEINLSPKRIVPKNNTTLVISASILVKKIFIKSKYMWIPPSISICKSWNLDKNISFEYMVEKERISYVNLGYILNVEEIQKMCIIIDNEWNILKYFIRSMLWINHSKMRWIIIK